MSPGFVGYYINLDRCVERREHIEGELRRLGLSGQYTRFPAIDGAGLEQQPGPRSAGERGCYASHLAVLREAASRERHVHVIEDDVLLSSEMMPTLHKLDAQGVFNRFDVLYLDLSIPLESQSIASYERTLRLVVDKDDTANGSNFNSPSIIDLQKQVFASMSSYVVAKRSVERLATLIEKGPAQPVDLVLRGLVWSGVLRAACCVPFLTSLNLAIDLKSTVRTVPNDELRSRLAASIVRHMYFVHPDWQALRAMVASHIPRSPPSARSELLMQALEYRIFGEFQTF